MPAADFTTPPALPDLLPAALRQALSLDSGILDALPIGLYVCDREGRVVRYNRRAAELWGREPLGDADTRYCGSLAAYHPDGAPLALAEAPVARVIETGEPVRDREAVIVRPDGSRIVILANADPLRDAEGRLIGAVNCFQDITALRSATRALREQDQRLAATYEHATIAIAEVDGEGRRMRVNEAACRITMRSREELVGGRIFDVVYPEDFGHDFDQFERMKRGEFDRYTIEKRVVRADGRTIWVLLMTSAVRDEAGRFLYAVRVFQDITERKRADDLLRESERRLRDLLGALPAAVYTTDVDGTVTFFNQAAADLAGRTPQLGHDKWCVCWRLYRADGAPLPLDSCPMAQALRERRPLHEIELIAERPDGRRIPVLVSPTPLIDENGTLTGAVNLLVDITERKQAEARQKVLLDELNHRVKNTLATVQSIASQTIRGSALAEPLRASFENRLIALSRAHNQLSQERWRYADVAQILADVFEPFRDDRHRIRMSGGRVEVGPQAALSLSMVLHELATNAVKFGALSVSGGALDVSWSLSEAETAHKLTIDWRESGGPPVAPPAHRGFGTKLFERAITSELHGNAHIAFDPAGVRCTIEVPLTAAHA